jgi:hypothetical protein
MFLNCETIINLLKSIEPQTLRDEFSWATKILDAYYTQISASLYGFIMTCQSLHMKKQRQLKIFFQRYENLFDGTLRDFNMEHRTNKSPTDGFLLQTSLCVYIHCY